MTYRNLTNIAAVAVLGLFLAIPAAAETIQADGADFLGFEADQYDDITGTQWITVDTVAPLTWAFGNPILPSDTNATGGTAMMTDDSGAEGKLTFNMTFKTAGTYYGYFHHSFFEDSAPDTTDADTYYEEDSFYISAAFGEAAGTAEGNVIDLDNQGFTPDSGEWEGTYRWLRVRVRGTNPLTFDVTAEDLNKSTSFEIRNRERGASVDYVIFSTNGALGDTELDQLAAVPEPSSMLLLAVGLLLAGGCLCRRLRIGHSLAKFFAVLALALLAASPVAAETIQADGVDFLGFEAEDFDANTNDAVWKTVDKTATLTTTYGTTVLPADTNASGGTAMYTAATDFNGNHKLTYNLTFKAEGPYYGYVRYSMFENSSTTSYGNEDSIFVSNVFDEAVAADDEHAFDFDSLGYTPDSGEWEGTYRWQRIKVRVDNSDPWPFAVDSADLNQPMTFQIACREGGASIDYVLFSTNGSLSDAELDQLMAVPEPSSLVLALAGLLVAGGCLRRRMRSAFSAVLALGLLMVSPVAAETIQADGADYLGFEAEDFDNARVGTKWIAVDTTPTKTSPVGNPVLPSDTNAFGGAALLDDFSGSRSIVTYDLTFKTAGTYYGYMHISMFENGVIAGYGNEDSVFVSPSFGQNAGTDDTKDTIFDYNVSGSLQWEGTYRWKQVTYRPAAGGSVTLTFDVSLADSETPLETYFELGGRESGASVDYILFSTNGNLGDAELDQLAAIPEPSSWVLALAGLLVAAGGFSRNRRIALNRETA